METKFYKRLCKNKKRAFKISKNARYFSMLEQKTFEKESEQYQFFHQLWEFGKFASACEHGKLYLEIAGQIIELLKNNDLKEFKELKQSLNGFIKLCQPIGTSVHLAAMRIGK